jgi:DNA-binding MarR family transcriptional regulator
MDRSSVNDDWALRAAVMQDVSWLHLVWKRHLERALRPHGIGLKQAFLLHHLVSHPATTPSQVARLLFCDRPTATSLLQTMVRRGWIRLVQHPEDGRSKVVQATPSGRKLVSRLPREASRDVPQMVDPLASLAADERRVLAALVSRMRLHLTPLHASMDDG